MLASLLVLCAAPQASAKPSCGSETTTGQRDEQINGGTVKVSVPASYTPSAAIALLVALHGDEGKPDYIYSVFRSLQQQNDGFILIAPRATQGGGSWYQATQAHSAYVDGVVADIIKRYNIDLDRVWITGWSGGATFLGYYAVKRQDLFAAVVYHMGSQKSSYPAPPGSCKIPARYVIGTADFLYDLAKRGHDDLQARGHEVIWIELPGVGHKFEKSTLAPTWQWLSAHTLCGSTQPGSCGGSPPPPPPPADSAPGAPPAGADSGGAWPRPDAGAGTAPDATPIDPTAPPAGATPTIPSRPGQNPNRTHLYGGCALSGGAAGGSRGPSSPSAPWPYVVVLLSLAALRRRR